MRGVLSIVLAEQDHDKMNGDIIQRMYFVNKKGIAEISSIPNGLHCSAKYGMNEMKARSGKPIRLCLMCINPFLKKCLASFSISFD